MLAYLKIWRVYRALDEIAGRVDHEKLKTTAFNLAAEQERDFMIYFRGLQRLAFNALHASDGAPDALRSLNMVGAFISVSISPVSVFSKPSISVDRTDWLSDRLPAEASAMRRSPGCV